MVSGAILNNVCYCRDCNGCSNYNDYNKINGIQCGADVNICSYNYLFNIMVIRSGAVADNREGNR